MALKTPSDMVYGLDSREFDAIFGGQDFDLHDGNRQIMERSVCGVARNYLDKFVNVAPLVPYGILARPKPGAGTADMLEDSKSPNQRPSRSPVDQIEIGVYKQMKGDKEILSIGISSEVLITDIASYYENEGDMLVKQLPIIDLMQSMFNSAVRELGILLNKEKLNIFTKGNHLDVFCGWMRDNVKKPGYEGGAHICAPYVIQASADSVVEFKQDGYEFVGWLTGNELMSLATMQDYCASQEGQADWVGIDNVYFGTPGYNEKLRPLMKIPLEPWSVKLCVYSFIADAIFHHFRRQEEGNF